MVLGIIIVICGFIIGFMYTSQSIENRKLKEQLNKEFEFTPYEPVRYIMFSATGSEHIKQLARLDLNAHKAAGIEIDETYEEQGCVVTRFKNGDELLVYFEGAPISPLKRVDIDKYTHRIFFDCKLPKGAERAAIQKLGLINYMVNIGFCDEESGK